MTVLGVGVSFIALYAGTGESLRGQIDTNLREQVAEWAQFRANSSLSTPGALARRAHRFIAGQRYHATSLITWCRSTESDSGQNHSDVVGPRKPGSTPRGP